MGHSIEARMPFLDYRLVSFIFSLPPETKIKNGSNKYILRKALKDDIPDDILSRRDKIGFVTPEAEWFRGDMESWISDIIHSRSFRQRGFYNVDNFEYTFEKHKKGGTDASRPIWRALNLEFWFRKFID